MIGGQLSGMIRILVYPDDSAQRPWLNNRLVKLKSKVGRL